MGPQLPFLFSLWTIGKPLSCSEKLSFVYEQNYLTVVQTRWDVAKNLAFSCDQSMQGRMHTTLALTNHTAWCVTKKLFLFWSVWVTRQTAREVLIHHSGQQSLSWALAKRDTNFWKRNCLSAGKCVGFWYSTKRVKVAEEFIGNAFFSGKKSSGDFCDNTLDCCVSRKVSALING